MKEIKRNEMIAVAVSVAFVLVILLIGILNSLSNSSVSQKNSVTTETNMEQFELMVKDIVVGDGEEAVAGMAITAHYVGRLDDGTVFDSSVQRGTPFTFVLGVGQVIKGWDIGVVGMKVGGKRELIIPANLAYGDRAIGAIPANSTLHFEVELLGVSAMQ